MVRRIGTLLGARTLPVPPRPRDRFRILFEYSRDAHLVFDETGILDCNDAAVELLQVPSKADLIGLHPAVLSPERQPDGRLSSEKSREMDRRAREEGFHRFDWMHCTPDGRPIPVEVTLTQVDYDGREALLVVWHDLSERVERERQLEEAKDVAERAMQSRARFLATMSHEMRTPLNGVIATSELLLERVRDPDGLELCRIIRDSADHLLHLINDVLDFSKIDAGRLDLRLDAVDVRAMVHRLIELVRVQAQEKGIDLVGAVDEEVPAHVLGDGPRIDQVLLNLLSNAVKFTQRGGVMLFVAVAPDRRIEFEVRDTGIGIPADQVERIFDPFRQVEGASTRRFGGTGLGLSISRDLARAMGGDLVCASDVGLGSRFVFSAALTPCDPPAGSGVEADEVSGTAGMRVLVAEDNAVNRRVLEMLLAKLDCDPVFAETGAEAVERFDREAVDLVLMDLHMPEMDGFESARRIRAAAGDVPILALTASTVEEELAACADAGMDEVLGKPVRLAGLRDALQRWSRRHGVEDSHAAGRSGRPLP